KVWEASGHLSGFSDPMVDCRACNSRFRADQLRHIEVVSTKLDEKTGENKHAFFYGIGTAQEVFEINRKKIEKVATRGAGQGDMVVSRTYAEKKPEDRSQFELPLVCQRGPLTEPRNFNLMFPTKIGALDDASATAYLRPETAQGIFANFRNVV